MPPLRPLLLLLTLAACQTLPAATPATVNLADPATAAAVTSALSSALGRARIELGPTDGPNTSFVTVLPPPRGPYETASPSRPTRFDFILSDDRCIAVRRDTGAQYPLPDTTCTPNH